MHAYQYWLTAGPARRGATVAGGDETGCWPVTAPTRPPTRDYRDRYRALATSLGFKGHMKWAEAAMTCSRW